MVFYFTATGNSLYVAKELDAHPVSIAQAIHDPNTSSLRSCRTPAQELF